MNVAMVSEHASPLATLGGVDAGGQNVHVAALGAALVKMGANVTVYTRRDAAGLPKRVVMSTGVVVEHVDAGPARAIPKDAIYAHVPAFAERLRQVWVKRRPDIVHAHFWMSGIAALDAAGPLGIPVVQTYHALGSEKRRHQGAADTSPSTRIDEEARIARDADRIIATASAEVFELLRMGALARTIEVVPCGVDLDRFSPSGARERRTPGRLRIVTLSRLVPRKGIDTVIEALGALPDAELVIAGGGEEPELVDDPEARRLAALAHACGVANRVSFRGRVERADVPELLRSADVVVCVPWYEPFGIVPLEAMACGVPVVVSSVGGLVDTVVDRVTGLHVPPRAPRDLAEALHALAGDAETRARMGHAGMQRVHARYAWQRIAGDTLAIYRDVAGGAGASELATGS